MRTGIIRKGLLTAAFAAAACVAGGGAEAAELKLLSSWDKSNWPTYAVGDYFVKYVHQDGGGKVKIAISGPEVVPPFEQIQPVSSGVFDMLFSHGVYHAGSKGLALAVDAIELDPYRRREAGILDYLDAYYQKHNNLKMVALPAQAFVGYHMFLREAPTAEGDVKGRKIRGTTTYHGIIKALGGTPVVLAPAQIYSSLEKGVIDGACWPAGGMLTMKHYEVAKFAVRPTFGTSNEPIWVNVNSWKKLAKAEQDVVLAAGRKIEYEMPWIGQEIYAKEEAELRKLGVQYVSLPPDKVALVKKTWNESVWALAKDCCGDGVDGLRDLALKAGLTN